MKLGGIWVFKPKKEEGSVSLESSLQSFFYSQLMEFNKKATCPLSNEAIYYSSLVMDKFGSSGELFETSEGKVREKVLGVKLLESSNLSTKERTRQLKDIGDTALIVCGFFSDSLKKKIIDTKYYQEVGQIAYRQLNSVVPIAYDIPSFFDGVSSNFDKITTVMNLVSEKTFNRDWDSESVYLFVSKKLIG